MTRAIIKLSDWIHRAVRLVAMSCFVIMLVTMTIQIVARYALSAPPIWTEEVARYMMVWGGLLGATMSFKTNTDAVLMDDILSRGRPVLRLGTALLRGGAVIVFFAPILYYSFFNARGTFGSGYLARQAYLTADTLGISMAWIASAVPLCATVILIHLAARWSLAIRTARGADPLAPTAGPGSTGA